MRDILDSGPVAYGLDIGIWTSPLIAWVIEQEFGVHYHPGHVRKLLHELDFSMLRPRRVLAKADPRLQDRWHRQIYPILKKSPGPKLGPDLQRRKQLPPRFHLYATRSRVGQPPDIPVTGQRKSVKILGAIELFQARFHYRQETAFNASTYLASLEQLPAQYRRQGAILLRDNASSTKTATSRLGSQPIDTGRRCTNCTGFWGVSRHWSG